jgi:hypothetical protein
MAKLIKTYENIKSMCFNWKVWFYFVLVLIALG